MERIDSHQHFWKYDPAQHTWMSGDMDVLKKDYGPDDLEKLLKACHLNGTVAVQASQTENENKFLLDLANETPFIKGIVGWVDLQSPGVSARLQYYKQFEKIKGFRHVIHDEPDIDFMLRPAFLNGIRALKEFDYTYDILIYPKHLPNTFELIKKFPDQLFVIDHIAKPDIASQEFTEWKNGLEAVATLPNVYCKISGMVTLAKWKQWKEDDFIKYMDAVIEIFNTDRIMYGSDHPVCTLSASYIEVYNLVLEYFSGFSQEEFDNFFGLNAKRFYKL